MAKQEQGKKGSEQSTDLEQRFKKMRELYADATPISKRIYQNAFLSNITILAHYCQI